MIRFQRVVAKTIPGGFGTLKNTVTAKVQQATGSSPEKSPFAAQRAVVD